MTDEATQKGVSESDSSFGADRLAKLNAISKDRAAERDEGEDGEDALALLNQQAEALDDELGNHNEEDEDTPPDADDQASDATPSDTGDSGSGDDPGHTDDDTDPNDTTATKDTNAADTGDDKPEPPVFFENGQWMTQIKVDGEIKTVPFAKVHAAAQKLDAGDKRLEEANRMLRDIEEREQRLLEAGQSKDQPPAQGADGQGQTENGHPNEETQTLIHQYHEALLAGDDDTAHQLLGQLATAGRQQPHVDVSQLAAEVEQRVARQLEAKDAEKQEAERRQERQQEMKEAYATFSKEFKDVVEDEQLTAMADRLTLTVAQEHPTYSPLEVMREAGKRTRQWLEEKAGTTTRVSRKRNLRTVSGNNARQPGKPEEKPKTRTDQLNEIRAARGQAPIG